MSLLKPVCRRAGYDPQGNISHPLPACCEQAKAAKDGAPRRELIFVNEAGCDSTVHGFEA